MQLVLQMLGKRVRRIFDPLEIEAVLVSATACADIGEAVRFQRLAVPVEVERLVLRAVGRDHELVRAGLGRFVAKSRQPRATRRVDAAVIVAGRRFEQRVLRHFLRDHRFELEIGQLQQADRLRQLRRQDQRLGLADVEAWAEGHA